MKNKKLKDKNNVKHNINYMCEIANERGGRCLSQEYINNKSHLLWECKNKHRWLARPDGIIRGTWCKICKGKAKYNLEFCKNIAQKNDGDCVSKEYVNFHTKLNFICKNGHEWSAQPVHIIAGHWCPKCARKIRK